MPQPHLTCLSSSGLSHGCTDVLNCGKSNTALCLCPCLTKLCRWDRPERVTRPSPEMRIWLALKLLEQKETILSTRKLAHAKWTKVWREHIPTFPREANTLDKTALNSVHVKYMTFPRSQGTPLGTYTVHSTGTGRGGGESQATSLELVDFFKKWSWIMNFAILGCSGTYHYYLGLTEIQEKRLWE